MDAENKALAYVLRHPPAEWAVKPLSYVRIAAHFVKKLDGSKLDTSTVRKAVKSFANQVEAGTRHWVAKDDT